MFDKNVTVWIDGGDSSHPMKVKKGTRVFMSGGHSYIAGEKNIKKKYNTIEEMRFMLIVYGSLVNHHIYQKLDLKTKLELLRNGIKVNDCIPFHLDLECGENIAHVYDNFEQYKNTLNYFVPDISDEKLKQGIYAITKNGQIISLDSICFDIITNSKKIEEQGPVKKLVPNNKK